MTVATTFRTDVASVAQAAVIATGLVGDNFEIVPGMLEGPMPDADRGSAWIDRKEVDDNGLDLENLFVHVRVFLRYYEGRGADFTPYDPAPLEQIGETLQTAFNTVGVQTSQGVWFLLWQSTDFDLERQSVELVFRGVNQNLYRVTT